MDRFDAGIACGLAVALIAALALWLHMASREHVPGSPLQRQGESPPVLVAPELKPGAK